MFIKKRFLSRLISALLSFVCLCELAIANQRTVIQNVNVLSMVLDAEPLLNTRVIIEGSRIVAVGASVNESKLSKPDKIIDGTGKWLIPGLIDMHVHGLSNSSFGTQYPTAGANVLIDTQDVMTPYVASGVTTIFELSERIGLVAQRNEIESAKVIGPRMALTGFIDGGFQYLGASLTANEARQAVRLAKNRGYQFVKLYSSLSKKAFTAAIQEAKKQNVKVVGHIPMSFVGDTASAFLPHFGLIAHAEELSKQTDDYSYENALNYARMAKKSDTWLIPNMSNMIWIIKQAESLDSIRGLSSLKYVHPLMQSKWLESNNYVQRTKLIPHFQKQLDFHKLLVRAFREEGVPMVAGTDAGTSGIVWGFSLHDELKFLVDAGMTELEALEAATRLPAQWLGVGDKLGTVETGKWADLILVDANPLKDIKNTTKISGVFFNGNWIDKSTIDSMLIDLAFRNTERLGKKEYDWKEVRKKF